MLTNGMFGTLLTPESIVTRTAFAATTAGEGVVLVTVGAADALLDVLPELLDEPPPPPPPHALTSNASNVARTSVMNVDF
jgi:hypothetical protein